MYVYAAVVFVVGVSVAGAQSFNGGDMSWYCDALKKENCSRQIPSPKCGTDGVTYKNLCFLSKAHCNDTSINQKHAGPCNPSEINGTTTTMSPEQVVHGSQVILDFQCLALSHTGCHHSIDETICATDGVTYVDFCEYEKARCQHRDLHVRKLGDCNA